MKFCGQCGQQLVDEAKFCNRCGSKCLPLPAVPPQNVTPPVCVTAVQEPAPAVTEPQPVPVAEPMKEPTPQAVAAVEPVKEPAPEAVAAVESVTEAIPQAVAVAEPVKELAPQPVSATEPVKEATPEAVAVLEPVKKPESQPVSDTGSVKQSAPAVEISAAPAQILDRLSQSSEPGKASKAKKGSSKKKPKSKKLKIMIISSVSLLLAAALAAGALYTAWYYSPEQRLLRTWDEGNYEKALVILHEDTDLRSDEDFGEALNQRLDKITAAYHDGTADYQQTMDALDVLERMQVKPIEQTLSDAITSINEIEDSRGCFAEAEIAFAQGDYLAARDLYQQVIPEDPNYTSAQEQVNACITRYREEIFAAVDGYIAEHGYPEAIELLEDTLTILPDDAQTIEKIAQCQSQYTDYQKTTLLNEAEALAQGNDLLGAIEKLDDYMEVNGEDDRLLTARDEYYNRYVTNALTAAEEKASADDYPGAFAVIEDALNFAPDNKELTDALTMHQNNYATATIKKSDEYLTQRKFVEAMEVVDEALLILPDNKELIGQVKKVRDATPLYLLDVSVAYDYEYYTPYQTGTFKMKGQEYTNGFVLGDDGYAYFNVSAKYTKLSLTVGHVDGTEECVASIYIFLDGELSQTLPLTPQDAPQQVEIDVTGIRQIRFEIYDDETEVDPILSEETPHYSYEYGFADIIVA